jgi:hypothetical protein
LDRNTGGLKVSDFSEIEQLTKDAERYRYIKRVFASSIELHPYLAVVGIRPPGKKYWFETVKDLDEALDEAMANEDK